MTDEDKFKLVMEYLADDFTHWEDDTPVTFIASFSQVKALIDAAYDRGFSDNHSEGEGV